MLGFVTSFASFRPAFHGNALSVRKVTIANVTMMAASKAIPFMEAPPKLDGSRPGDFGFDPMYMSENMDQDWMCAAELKNGRVAMLACLGFVIPELIHLPGAVFSETNPIKAITTVPNAGWIQILFFIMCIELATFKESFSSQGADYGFDPLNLWSKGDPKAMRVREIVNGRLAMIGILGFVAQTLKTGKPIIAQLTSL